DRASAHVHSRSLHDALPICDGAPDLYPERWRDEIDEINDRVFHDVNNGVYRAGFAASQAAYEAAYEGLFARLDELTEHLSTRRYPVGDHITEADIRRLTTLVRFEPGD